VSDQVTYRRQTTDYWGTLQTSLRDLRGIGTLAYELIQNADDVLDEEGQPGATRITFDVCDDALIVENDGVFRDVDYDRIANIASGGKREEEGTTGAFGIGFISVYQITDSPEIISSGKHWRIRPDAPDEDYRIEIRNVQTHGTRFRLPWAFDAQSEVRHRLRVEAIRPEQPQAFVEEISQAISRAALFLKHLEVLELKESGRLVKRIERLTERDDAILVAEGDRTCCWHIFHGSFKHDADRLRALHPMQIERKKSSDVLLAIPDEPMDNGRLYAVLPSDTTIPLPFHINADFFPSSDRKRIILESDYQSEWNRAAIRAAAQVLAANIERLSQLLGHHVLWRLISSLNECRRAAEQRQLDPVFSTFWERVAPRLSDWACIYAETKEWVKPHAARLLESKNEIAASSILVGLGIEIVHSDLREHFGLLQQKEISVPLLSVQDVVQALANSGVRDGLEVEHAPRGLRSLDGWRLLWLALETMHKRPQQTPSGRVEAESALSDCPIAMDKTGHLWSPARLFSGEADTQQLFPSIRWLTEEIDSPGIPTDLVPLFSAPAAVNFLNDMPIGQLEATWKTGGFDILALYCWLEARKQEILDDVQLRDQLRCLPIWPAAGHLCSLEGLYIPGGFEDPFKIAGLVDLQALGGRREFLKDLGVQELTFTIYAQEQVPKVLLEQSGLPLSQRRQIVQLLARRFGEINDYATLSKLSPLSLVECTDGEFYPASQAYLPSDVMELLGSRVHIAEVPQENKDAVLALYQWLGVEQEPRPDDVLARVKELCTTPPNRRTAQQMETIFGYLVEGWPRWEDDYQQRYKSLRHLGWLPGTQTQSQWYEPQELYAIFQRYLFESQANFLVFPQNLQNQAATVKLIEFLGIQDKPTVALVVRHLLTCSHTNSEVNREVYRFLSNNAQDPALDQLEGTACLLLPDGNYVRPDQVFWGKHPFGQFCHQLGSDLRQYNDLFDRLGVREAPDMQDYIQVLLEISEGFGQRHAVLDEETFAVVMNCWEALSQRLEQDATLRQNLQALQEHKVIPNDQNLLIKSKYIFFEDRPGLKERLHMEHHVIKRPLNAWRAMEAVGVRLLGQAVDVQLVESPDSSIDDTTTSRFSERRELILRVIESEKASGIEGLDVPALTRLQFERAQPLLVQYVLTVDRRPYVSEPEPVQAQLVPSRDTLLVQHDNGYIPWPAVAREIAYAIKPVGEIGGLAGGIKEALAPTSLEEASHVLDELGYPPLSLRPTVSVPERPPVEGFGGSDAPQDAGDGPVFADPEDSPPTTPVTGDGGHPPATEDIPGGPTGIGASPSSSGGEQPPLRTPKRRKQSRIFSYVYPDDLTSEPSEGEPEDRHEHRIRVEKAGIAHVLEHEIEHSREPEEMPHLNPGFDIRSIDGEGNARYIEVKSLSGIWDSQNPAQVTRAEFEEARARGDEYWLYVVELATSEEPQIHCIQNPAKWVQRYLLDHGWLPLVQIEA